MDCVVLFNENINEIDFYVNTQKYIPIDILNDDVWKPLHPAYPHGNIPIPFFEHEKAISVEGVWEALKLFETCGVDDSKFYITDMKNIRRTEEYYGNYIGHRIGSNILTYEESYDNIYKKLYTQILETSAYKTFQKLKNLYENSHIVIIDDTYKCMAGTILKNVMNTTI
jgi:hypothetical protein